MFLNLPSSCGLKTSTLLCTAAGEKSERSALPGGGIAEIGRQIWAVLSIPTFLIIVLQVLQVSHVDDLIYYWVLSTPYVFDDMCFAIQNTAHPQSWFISRLQHVPMLWSVLPAQQCIHQAPNGVMVADAVLIQLRCIWHCLGLAAHGKFRSCGLLCPASQGSGHDME